jgi:hypothetical protein
MIRRVIYLVVAMALTSALYAQQTPLAGPRDHDIYCAGTVTRTPLPRDTYIISGVESAVRILFHEGDLVYINRGSSQGVQVGAEFLVSREVKDRSPVSWFVWQKSLMRTMGTAYADIGRIRVVHVDARTSTAQIVLFCDQMQRGDIVRPFAARPAPNYKPAAALDIFAPASGKKMGMLVSTRDFGEVAAAGRIVYVNLGSEQGARVGDYYRIFRYQGDRHGTAYTPRGQEHAVAGFGSAPGAWQWSDLPREILGEGIVLNLSQNASTLLITDSLREIYPGDYVEIE